MSRRSLRFELLVTLAVVLVMAVLSLSFLNEWLTQQRARGREMDRLEQYTEGLAGLVARAFRGPVSFDHDTVQDLFQEQIAAQRGLLAVQLYRVVDGQTQELAAVGDFAGVDASIAAPDQVVARELPQFGVVVIEAPLPISGGRDDPGATPILRVVAEPVAATSAPVWRETAIVAAGVAVVLLVFGGALIELQVTRPLRVVQDGAARLASGDLETTIPDDGPAEIAELAADFNRMTRSLRAQIDTVAAQREALQRSEQLAAIGRLAAGVAHEVGNPLAAIHGYTEFLLDPRSKLDDEERQILQRVQTQTERIQGIVSQLLDYSRDREPVFELQPLRPAAEEVLALLPRAADADDDLDVAVQGSERTQANVDGDLLTQVLLNLAINAAHAARQGAAEIPRVRITISPPSTARPWIEVQDNGPGVPEEVRPRLFEPFFTTRSAGEGTGLGLAISHGLVERLGGELRCLPADARSPIVDGEPSGAVFRVELAPETRADA